MSSMAALTLPAFNKSIASSRVGHNNLRRAVVTQMRTYSGLCLLFGVSRNLAFAMAHSYSYFTPNPGMPDSYGSMSRQCFLYTAPPVFKSG